MAILNILTAPDPKLRLKAERVEDIAAVQGLIDDMLETLYATENGIGLAATQVGRKEAVVIIDLSESRDQPLVLINPQLISGTEKVLGQEGCLSVPDYYADVERYSSVVVSALDRKGNPITIESSDFWPLSCSMKLIIWMATCSLITCHRSSGRWHSNELKNLSSPPVNICG